MNNAKKFMGIALVLSVLSIWSIAQTNQTAAQKVEAGIDETQSKSVQSLTNNQLLSSAGTIIATNNGVTITQGPGASIPEGPEPQGGWFTPFYKVEGMVNSHRRVSSNTFSHEVSLPFSFSTDGNTRWKMEFHEYNKEEDTRSTNYFFCDGTNIFNISQHDKSFDREGNVILDPAIIRVKVGDVSSGQIPLSYRDEAGLIWLVFMGGNYLLHNGAPQQQGTYRMVDVLSNPSSDPTAWCCDFRYLFKDSYNPLISNGYFVLNTNYISLDDTDYLGISEEAVKSDFAKIIFEELKNIKTNNLCYSIFKSTEYVSVGDVDIPIRFSSERFDGVPLEEKNKLPFIVKEGLVTNVIAAHRVVPMFPNFGIVSVQDNRFRYRTKDMYRGSIYYMCTNELEIAMDSPKLREAGSQRLLKRTFRKENKERNYTFISILIIAVVTPLIVLPIISHWRKQG
ncbi:MAG: hypothetical protein PHF76_12200 [Bacteroidales bacterium]|nr:hypothetical protein [Bacteroidales bacterium]